MVFDAPALDAPFEERLAFCEARLRAHAACRTRSLTRTSAAAARRTCRPSSPASRRWAARG